MTDALNIIDFPPQWQAIVAPLQAENKQLKQQAQYWKEKYNVLWEQLRLAQQRQFSASSESQVLPPEDLQFDEAESVEPEQLPVDDSTITITYTRKKPIRRPLPANLPRHVIEYDVADADKHCACGCIKQRIGEEITEQLEFIPAKLSVIAHIRPKYACNRCDEGVSIAPMPKLFLPKSMATPSLVAQTIVSKFNDHLPLARQEKIWQRLGIEMPRNTVCGWLMSAAEQCLPMRDALLATLKQSNYVQADETPVQVLGEAGRANTSTSYMWVYQTGRPDKKVIVFDYRPTRQAAWPKEILQDFKGYVQTDGYGGYHWVEPHPDLIHLGCLAHARRPFAQLVKLAKTTGKAHQAVAYFAKLYAIEKTARLGQYSWQQRFAWRLEKAAPILNELRSWLDQSLLHAFPQSALGKALAYVDERWQSLTRYLLDGQLEIDTNALENQIRPFALGRKNWVFAASPRGAQASALFYSLIATANAHALNPFNYLKFLFENIRCCKTPDDYHQLLPFNLNPNQFAH